MGRQITAAGLVARCSLPEYASARGRMRDYVAFVRELQADPSTRFVMLDGGHGCRVPGVEIPIKLEVSRG